MSKEELLELTGEVIEKLPNAMFRVKLENGVEILAHTAGKMRKFRIRVMVGDKVDIEMTPYDLTKGRIICRNWQPWKKRRKLSRLIVSGVKSMMFCCLTNMERSRQRPC